MPDPNPLDSHAPLYVYAIAAEALPLHDLTGIFREPLHLVALHECRAIAGQLAVTTPAAGSPPISADLLRAQDALVRELAARAAALLPARFGTRFDGEPALRETLESLAPQLAPALARVRDCEQMTIRLFGTSAPSPAPPAAPATEAPDSPGTAYLRRRVAELRVPTMSTFPPEVRELLARLAGIAREERIERGRGPVIASVHHLVPRHAAAAYRMTVESGGTRTDAALDVTVGGLRLRVSGPSPVYAFAGIDLR